MPNKFRDRFWGSMFWILVTATMVVCLVGGAAGIAPSWRAQVGDGTRGTFTATRLECRKACFVYGDFTADDGVARRTDVMLLDGPEKMTPGSTEPALDTGERGAVYSTSGGPSLVWALAMTAGGLVLAAFLVRMVILSVRRRRRRSA
ncbi:hypothetical protein [Micromonospora auratinigra]|uniref:hypothetical protein n=1 Tax=Micromonospora auratinigra TaxID=261654 RepID=UPI0012FE624B|nr:hypothetical protein [Micromonospora auratinigra]